MVVQRLLEGGRYRVRSLLVNLAARRALTEGPGLSRDVEAMADHRISIPMCSDVDSLNLAVATGIALSRIMGG